MNADFYAVLEYGKIKAMLASHTRSALGRELVERLEPMTDQAAVESALNETVEAAAILERGAEVPLFGLTDVRELVGRLERGAVLAPAELLRVADFLRGCAELKRYMRSKRQVAPVVSLYAEGINELGGLAGEIEAAINGARVADAASPRLARVRREMQIIEGRIQARLQSYLASPQYREALQESFVSTKDGHHVLPVKVSHRHRIDGAVVAVSGSGSTVFIEPAAVGKLTQELQGLRAEEEAEEYQVLTALSGLAATEARAMTANLEIVAAYDFAFAKGRLGLSVDGVRPGLAADHSLRVVQGRHPLLGGDAIPLDLDMGGADRRVLVITGPNTGGKTVALKTVGLLALMAQSGLFVPAATGTVLPVFEKVLADIGDGQDVANSLSTFSSHMGRIAAILREVGRARLERGGGDSLVLLDEVGTGTDPAEGAALAMAVLEELHELGALTVATTHYGDVKRLAEENQGFINGRMDFDPATLQPLYRLIVGEAGNSHAFWIAERLGLGPQVLERAKGRLSQAATARPIEPPHPHPREVLPPPAPRPTVCPAAGPAADTPPAAPVPATADKAAATDRPWQLGDSVYVQTLNQKGVVCELPDSRGDMIVFTRGQRVVVNHKRVKLLVAAEHLYPEGYDMRVALYAWADRKLMRQMEKRHVDGQVRVIKEGTTRE